MNLFYGILLISGLFFVVLISFPILIQIQSKWFFLIQWTLFKLSIAIDGNQVKMDLLIFNWHYRFGQKKSPKKKAETPTKKKPKKKIPFDALKEALFDKAVSKSLNRLVRFFIHSVKALKIRVLRCNIGSSDYYWQGILIGLFSSLPRSRNFQISGNFEEANDFYMVVRLSIWRLLWAMFLLILFFPYYRIIKLIFKVRRSMVPAENT